MGERGDWNRFSMHTCFVTSKGPNLIVIPSVLVEVMTPLTKEGFPKLLRLNALALAGQSKQGRAANRLTRNSASLEANKSAVAKKRLFNLAY